MDEKQLQMLFNEYAKGKGFKDFGEFKSLMEDEGSRKVFFEDSNKELGFKDFNDFNATLGVKKKEPAASLATPSRLPKISEQVSPLQQGANIVGGGVIGGISKTVPKGSIKEAALADKKKNESYLGALWNNVVGSVGRLASAGMRATYQLSGNPVVRMERELLDKAGKYMGKNLLAEREKELADVGKKQVERLRTSASSKEYEQKLAEGFDVTNGVGIADLKGLGTMAAQFAGDMGLAVASGGGSFALQGYDDALSMVDEVDKDRNMSEGTRIAFGLGGAVIFSVLDKLGLDNLVKTPAAKKYVTAKVIKEATDELVKKGVKVTAEQFENTVKQKASQLTRKEIAKAVGKKAATGFIAEGSTEVGQEVGIDLLKLAANKIENKEIFDEEEMKDTAAKRYLNTLVGAGALGSGGGAISARFQNTEAAIKDRLKNVKTVEDIDSIVAEINDNVADGTMTQEEADNVLPIVQNFVDVSQKVPADLIGKNKVEAVDLIGEREKISEQLKQIEEQKAALDPAFHNLLDEDAKQLQEREKEINNELVELAKPENNVEEVIQQPIEDKKADIERTLYGTISGSIPLSQALPNGVYINLGNGLFAYADKNEKITAIVDRNNNYLVSKSFWNEKKNKWQLPNQANLNDDANKLGVDETAYIKKYKDAVDSLNAKYDAELKALEEQQIPDENIQQPIEEQPELVEAVRVEQEPELPEGTKVVTLSGMEEGERAKAVEERKKKTTLTEKETLHNDLIDLANRADKARGNEKTNLQGQIRQRVRELNAKLGEELYKYDGVSVRAKVKSKTKGERYLKIKGTTRDTSGRAIKEDAVLLFDRSPEFVQKYEELADSPNITALQVDSGNGVSMTADQIESALQDIADGIPSVQADNLLNALEEGFNRGYFDLRGKDIGQNRVQASVEDFIGVQQEEVGQPMDEDAMVDWLNEIAELPQEEQIEIDNIILEYEQQLQQTDISGKVQSPNAPSKTTSTPSPKPSEEGKGIGSPQKEVNKQPIGEAKPKQEDVEPKSPLEQQYEEASQKKGEKAQQKAKEKLISDNFDGIVAQLMTKNKIKRKC